MTKVLAKNQGIDDMKSPQRKPLERVLAIFAIVITLVVVSMFSGLSERISQAFNPNSSVYGVWIEQNVAPYAAEKIILNKHGVTVKGRVVATQFRFDGSELSYQFGNQTLRYKMKDNHNTEMKLISEPYYQPVFQLSGKHKNDD